MGSSISSLLYFNKKESSEAFKTFVTDAIKICNPSHENEFLDKFFLTDAYFGPYDSSQESERSKFRILLSSGHVITYRFKTWLEEVQNVGEFGMIDETEHRQSLAFNLRNDMLGKVNGVTKIIGLYSDDVNFSWPNSTGSFFCVLVNNEWKCFIPFPYGCYTVEHD